MRQPDPYLPAEIIENKYRLVRPLGEGGMGTVWVAHNVVLDVQVAIKLINIREGNTSRSSERLLQEARAAARLGHPAIVRVFDFGRTRRGDPFVVMELIRGTPLSEHARHEQRLPAIRAVQLMLPIADALSVAHGKGIVHRDVKADNVILAADEAGRIQPKLLDFGIASMVETNSKLTLEGTVLGTPDYMSPEQARGCSDLDHRTDVWSFSVMLYELLTGRLPFTGRNYNALLWSIVHENPKPVTHYAAGDDQLWRVIERGLRKEPSQRWESMRVMGEALALWLYERGVREDVCAASLKTNWLDAGLTGVRIEVSSVAPGADEQPSSLRGGTLAPTPIPSRPDVPSSESGFFELAPPTQRGEPRAAAAAETFREPFRKAIAEPRRRLVMLVAAAIGLASGALVVAVAKTRAGGSPPLLEPVNVAAAPLFRQSRLRAAPQGEPALAAASTLPPSTARTAALPAQAGATRPDSAAQADSHRVRAVRAEVTPSSARSRTLAAQAKSATSTKAATRDYDFGF